MNRRIWIIVVIAILAIGTVSAVSYMKVKDPFLGAWESIDVDGSHQYLWVLYNVDGAYLGIYYDDGASACGDLCMGAPPADGVSSGHRIEDWGLSTDGFTAYCLGEDGPSWLLGFSDWSVEAAYTYDPTTDELFNIVEDSPCPPGGDVEVRWKRIGLGKMKQLLK
jgi:hypothetical protein